MDELVIVPVTEKLTVPAPEPLETVNPALPEMATLPPTVMETVLGLLLAVFKARFTVVNPELKLKEEPIAEFQVKSEKDWPKPDGAEAVAPETKQVEPVLQVQIAMVPAFILWS